MFGLFPKRVYALGFALFLMDRKINAKFIHIYIR